MTNAKEAFEKPKVSITEVRKVAAAEKKWCKVEIARQHRRPTEYEKGFMDGLKQIPIMLVHYMEERDAKPY